MRVLASDPLWETGLINDAANYITDLQSHLRPPGWENIFRKRDRFHPAIPLYLNVDGASSRNGCAARGSTQHIFPRLPKAESF
jgi:hypothetical protein